MPMSVRDGGTWKPVGQPYVRTGGVWRNILRAWVRDGGSWREFFAAFSASATPTSISGLISGSGTATSNNTTAVPANAIGTPSYSWEIVNQSGSPVVVDFTASTSPVTAVSASLSSGQTVTGNIRCNVTDGTTGITVQTNNVAFTLGSV